MLLMIDNYDSFTYNLVQYFGELGEDVQVYRNDKISLSEIDALKPRRLVISPGPCTPKEAGISVEAIRYFGGKLPLLGVCLGHQSLAVAFGGALLARLRPQGMAVAMAAAGGAQLLIAIIAFIAALASPTELGLTLAFALPWLASAALFHMAARG